MSLKNKYIVGVSLVLVVVFGSLSYKNLKAEEQRINSDSMAKLTLMTKVIKNALMALMLEGKAAHFQEFVEMLIAEDINAVRLYREDGTIMSSSVPAEKGRAVGNGVPINPASTCISSKEKGGHLIYSMTLPIFNERPCQGCHGSSERVMGILSVEIVMDSYYKSIRDSRVNAAIFYISSFLILSLSLGAMTAFLVTRPLEAIIKTVKRVEEGDLNARFLTDSKDEVGDLAKSLDSMLAELYRARQEVENCHIDSIQKVEKLATIGELASAIAHEIKNPLAGISGAIQVFAEDFLDSDPRRGIINEVLSEIDRLDKAVRDLLNFARPPEPHRIKTQVMPVIERALRLVAGQAKKQGVDTNIVMVDDIEDAYIDPEQMQQVFLNIMINALHSMPGGGEITITTYRKAETNEVDVVISDTGHGISQADIKNIFKPFFTTKHMGTGLGLAISKAIVEKHGGDIYVSSQMGAGSNFRIAIPVWRENA
ncbi:MAG: ATP-binding protein [Thermodesulfovibrionales bacterium]|nr:ATP-binding protein [Thermodesulfovibrionales bacterium]